MSIYKLKIMWFGLDLFLVKGETTENLSLSESIRSSTSHSGMEDRFHSGEARGSSLRPSCSERFFILSKYLLLTVGEATTIKKL
jgi:hypothetical protein